MLSLCRLLGLSASMGVVALWGVFAIFNPFGYLGVTTVVYLIPALMILLAIVGVFAVLTDNVYLMLVVFGLSFVPIGFYTLGTPGIFRWIGIFNLLFLGAGLLMFLARRTHIFRMNR